MKISEKTGRMTYFVIFLMTLIIVLFCGNLDFLFQQIEVLSLGALGSAVGCYVYQKTLATKLVQITLWINVIAFFLIAYCFNPAHALAAICLYNFFLWACSFVPPNQTNPDTKRPLFPLP